MTNGIRRLTLGSDVVSIKGSDVLDRISLIEFIPSPPHEEKPGWYWITGRGEALPANISLARLNSNPLGHSVELRYGRCYTPIWEHTGTLRWTGLSRVRVRHTSAPPYFGRTHEIWQALIPHLREDNTNNRSGDYRWVDWAYGNKEVKIDHTKIPDGHITYTPHQHPCLDITIKINYPKLGEYECAFSIPGCNLDEIFSAHSQGWPPWLKWPAKRWTHGNKVIWPQDNSAETTLHMFALHRCADLLGTLSLADHEWLLAGKIVSSGAGHEEDLQLVREICQNNLTLIE